MYIKLFFTSLFMLLFKLNGAAQATNILSTPEGWTVEKFMLPPTFANDLPFKGTEDIRFSPDWNKKKTAGYWTYCYLWTLQGNPSINKADLEDYLRRYYAGLIKLNLTESNIDTAIVPPTELLLKSTFKNKVYEGRITMLDYMTQDPITLNIRIYIKQQGRIFFELSALPYNNEIWKTMDGIGNLVK